MKRFVIKFPDGTYSNGPAFRRVAFEKAKLWKNIGHVKNHITGLGQYPVKPYPKGTEIVEVEFTAVENTVMLVEDARAEYRKKVEHRKAEQALRCARQEVEWARKHGNVLEKAEKKLAKVMEHAKTLGIE